jgi:hypothetical protein
MQDPAPDDYGEIFEAADAYRLRFGQAAPVYLFAEAPGLVEALQDAIMTGTPWTLEALAARLKMTLPPEDACW